jgi:NAD(P)-dependent dehydrogenase (short-subunit alcohol dehydrogenase family)
MLAEFYFWRLRKFVKNVAVITGGVGGMGLATAKLLGISSHVIITDINQKTLEIAARELEQSGIGCDPIVCDVTNKKSVEALVSQASERGVITSVVHTAGISPQMGDPEKILRVNALGTVNITDAFYPVARNGFALVNVSSMAAYMLPKILVSQRIYRRACVDPDKFLRNMKARYCWLPKEIHRRGVAYMISKHFVGWYSRINAAKFGSQNARILSISPGTFDTDMGRLEKETGSFRMLEKAALRRPGTSEEIAEILAFFASEKAGYTTGVDILCDGGVIAGRMS